MQPADFLEHGYCRFVHDPDLLSWGQAIHPVAAELAWDEELRAEWLRSGGTWFAGVNVLPNTRQGELGHSGPLRGDVISFLRSVFPHYELHWDQAQISVCYPGYPMPGSGESEGAFGYRVNRAAAHMDGLHPIGAERRRYWREFHGFILGIPLAEADPGAAPLVVWRGSHVIMRQMLADALSDHDVDDWSQVDLTEAYHAARQQVFETCDRVELSARPGEATLLHRFALHGMSPWKEGAKAGPDGRMIAYFRPSFDWSAETSLRED